MDAKNWKEMFHSMWKRKGNPFFQFLLDAGLDVNELNKYGTTMLSNAVDCGNLEMAEFLVQKGADANVANSDGSKPLHIAAKCGRKDIGKFFLDRGISVDSCDNDECTPLHYIAAKTDLTSACRESYQELVHILVDRNANINAVNRKGFTPLLLAAQNSCKHVVELFIKLGADLECCDENQWTVLHHACQNGWTGIVRTLLEGRFEIDLNAKSSVGRTPVMIAANCSHEDIVKLLIESGVEVEGKDDFGNALLHFTCGKGLLDLVKCLVGKGCGLNVIDKEGLTPLMTAAYYSHSSVAEYLIESGADVECFTECGHTVLHCASKEGLLEIVKSLVSRGCDLNAKDNGGNTPLMMAACYSQSSVAEYLIECGADVECFGTYGLTVLHFACFKGLLEIVKSLTKKVSNVNVLSTVHHVTPLHVAIRKNHLEIIKHLLNAGADCNIKNQFGKSAFNMYIHMSPCLEVITLFIRNGAYFQTDHCAVISNSSLLKEGIFQNTQLCTVALINKFNNSGLRKIYEIPGVSETLPSIEELRIASRCIAAQNIAESVEFEIQSKGYCDLLNARPFFLRSVCLRSLFAYYEI